MKQGIALLDQFDQADADWMLATAAEHSISQGDYLIEKEQPLDTLFVIVQGVFGVFAEGDGERLAVLGPGDLAGEMSFLEGTVPTESVRALEHSIALAIPHAALQERAEEQPGFAARLYRTFSRLLAGRLRAANRRLAAVSEPATGADGGQSGAWQRLDGPLQAFKQQMLEANKAAAETGDVPDAMSDSIVTGFLEFCPLLHQVLSEEVVNERVREEMGLRVQQELLPYILMAETAERFYSKPRGYAGDFWTIELIYRNRPEGNGALGRLIDRCFLETTAARAVRNRRALLAEEIGKTVETRQGPTARITSLACGPARELFDIYATQLEHPDELHANLIDIDLQALAYVSDQARTAGLERQMSLISENLIRLALGKTTTPIRDQDFIYSIGLIDYFGDELVVRLLDLIHSMLRPGGRVMLGNIHPVNPTRGLMDHVLDWKLIHRTEEEMDQLFERSAFGRPCTAIRFENEGINLFAECVR
ncbi:MAG: cyclic nucleotide-binding domain-containing protein [Ectothiorhodospiraceae bacterium]|nr:cyclic nucleotide-binding domain-containing protein [Ectothiorhodospiraceae bacterium]